MILTILTPTYNRGPLLNTLFQSLKSQSVKDFQWLIIDDGSTDQTKSIVDNFYNDAFKVDYCYKSNGGKCSALNYAHEYIRGDWVLIVDSDDVLLSNAVELVLKYIDKYNEYTNIGCISFERINKKGISLAKNVFKYDYVSNAIDYRTNMDASGDRAEIYKLEVLKEFPFPIFKGEKFLGEAYLHISAAYKYNTVYVNEAIYICEYLSDGLTMAGRKMRLENPIGGMLYGSLYFNKRFKAKYRIKGMMLFICYSMVANVPKKKLFMNCRYKLLCLLCFIPGILLYFYWKYRYLS